MLKRLLVVMALMLVAVPLAAQETTDEAVELASFESAQFGIQGVIPDGWNELAPGSYRRGNDATDSTLLAVQAAPVPREAIETQLAGQLQLDALPEASETRETEAFTWDIYEATVESPVGNIAVTLGLTSADGRTIIVLLQSAEDDHSALVEDIFTPVLASIALYEPVAETTAEATAEPVPYVSEDVSFESGDITLAGTLTLPEGDAPFPAVVLISGSGASDRNESIAPIAEIEPFRILADHLTRQGVAVLRYDDRGVGESGGDFATATLEDFAQDASAAVDYLLTRDAVDADALGLLGHSEGGTTAPLVVEQNDNVDFVVSLAGPSVPLREILIEQNRRILAAEGVDESMSEPIIDSLNALFDAIETGDEETIREALRDLIEAQLEMVPENQRPAVDALVDQFLPQYTSNYFETALTLDPAAVWSRVEPLPVLAIYGEKDTQVDAQQNIDAWQQIIADTDFTDDLVTIETFENANHLFQEAETGSPNEYGQLEQTMMDSVLTTISDWIQARAE